MEKWARFPEAELRLHAGAVQRPGVADLPRGNGRLLDDGAAGAAGSGCDRLFDPRAHRDFTGRAVPRDLRLQRPGILQTI